MHNKTNLYRRIAISFVVISVLIALSVFYFSFSWATVVVTPRSETFTSTQTFSLTDKEPKNIDEVKATVETKVLDAEGQFSITNTQEETGRMTGTITLINTGPTPQPLRSTTRLLSANNVLFRMKDYATIPARGKVDVEVYADKEGDVGTVDSSRFSVPGLSESMQAIVYGQGFTQKDAAVRQVKVVRKEDIENAVQSLRGRLETKFREGLSATSSSQDAFQAVDATILTTKTSVKEGEKADQISVKISARFVAVTFDRQTVYQRMVERLKEKLAANQQLVEPDPAQLNYQVTIDGPSIDQMRLKVSTKAKKITSQDSRLFETRMLTNKSKSDIRSYFSNFDDIESVDVRFYPFWVVRAPALADHINILLDTK